jgi:ribosomal protein S18 acetylase RimI-like enzyme
MQIRPIQAADAPALSAFLERIPEGDRTFFKEDIREREIVASWLQDTHGRRSAAVEADGRVLGYVAVIPGVGWSSHVGELRLVVDPNQRRRGLGRQLAQRGLVDAIQLGLGKIVVEVVADQTPAVAMFQSLGFNAEALLRDHVRDRSGALRDLIVLAHSVNDSWSEMATIGIEDALKKS